MRCQCGSANPAGNRFCEQCGQSLARLCPGCGREASADARFCGGCGQRFDAPAETGPAPSARELPSAPALAAARTAGPKVAAAAGTSAIAGERRQLTILFIDLVGSTEISTRLDPEEWSDVLEEYHRGAADVIARFGGTVAKFLGDGVLALFGYPQANEDDAERAVRAGLAVLESVRVLVPAHGRFAAERATAPAALSVRVGFHTGVSVVADRDDRPDVFGEAPNVAARVQDAASADTVVISAATERLVAGLFVLEPLGARTLKGLAAPMSLYRVLRPSGVRSRIAIAADCVTPLVGRRDELGVLVGGWERAKAGSGRAVLVVGEAGVGKSRLIYELRSRLEHSAHGWLECGATPYAQGTPFHPVLALVSQALMIAPDD